MLAVLLLRRIAYPPLSNPRRTPVQSLLEGGEAWVDTSLNWTLGATSVPAR